MSGFLVINPRSGQGRPDASELRAEAERLGIATHVLAPEDDPAELARGADGPLGVAGGDGSLAAVAEVAVERDVPFVVVPSEPGTTSPATSGSNATIRSPR